MAGTFTPTGSMSSGRVNHTATLLADGTVLVVGGYVYSDAVTGDVVVTSAERYDPVAGSFALAGSPVSPRDLHTATLLNDGRVLVAGGVGYDIIYNSPTNAERYDPVAGAFATTGNPITNRVYGTATLLSDGKVLFAGGIDVNEEWSVAGAELYDPTSGAFAATGSLGSRWAAHLATRLNNRLVLIVGEIDNYGVDVTWATAELYDPQAGTFAPTSSMAPGTATLGETWGRAWATATLLADGLDVLIAGGSNFSAGGAGVFDSAELYEYQ